MFRKAVIGVVGSGQEAEPAVSNARLLGRLIAERNWILITGGRNAGVMRAANDGAQEANGFTVGILPDRDTEIADSVALALVTDLGEARNNIIVLSADVIVACGVTDPGTSSEVALALKAGTPVVLLNADLRARAFFDGVNSGPLPSASRPEDAVSIVEELLGELGNLQS